MFIRDVLHALMIIQINTSTCLLTMNMRLVLQARNLWSYHSIANALPGVRLRDAETLLPMRKAQLYIKHNFTIHHISDIVRLYAVAAHPGSDHVSADHLLAPATDMTHNNSRLPVRMLCSTRGSRNNHEGNGNLLSESPANLHVIR